jgi:hypothetical protein
LSVYVVKIKQWFSNSDGGEQGWDPETSKLVADRLIDTKNMLFMQKWSKSTEISMNTAILKSKSVDMTLCFSFTSALVSV